MAMGQLAVCPSCPRCSTTPPPSRQVQEVVTRLDEENAVAGMAGRTAERLRELRLELRSANPARIGRKMRVPPPPDRSSQLGSSERRKPIAAPKAASVPPTMRPEKRPTAQSLSSPALPATTKPANVSDGLLGRLQHHSNRSR